MKRLLLLAALFAATMSGARAYDFSAVAPTGQTLYYNIVSGGVQVTSQNTSFPYYNYSTYPTGALTIPDSVTRQGTTYAVVSIGDYAFRDCSGLTSVTIPDAVTSIGNYAFQDCSGLTSVTIPDAVTSIGPAAFEYCSGLTSVTIPNSVISIGNYAFCGCSGLTSVTIGSGVASIGNNAFRGCSGLTSVTIPNSVTSIGEYAFSNCSGLTSVTISNSVTSIAAFSGCSGLTSVTIPNSVTYIGFEAFSGCSGLTSVTIPNSVTSIGNSAFSGCSGLTSVTIPNSVTSIGNQAFSNCSGLTSVTIPNSVTSIEPYAFFGCSGLTSVTIPNSVTYIYAAFSGCSGLTSVTIPNSVTYIGTEAFYGCSGLTSITIPSSVTGIGTEAFYNCSGLTEIHSEARVAPLLGTDCFAGVPINIPVYIPCVRQMSYNSYYSRWSYFSNFIEADGFSFSATSADDAMGSVTVLTQPTCQSPTAVVNAIAANGYLFQRWNNGVTNNPYSLVVTSDTALTAIFVPENDSPCDTVYIYIHDTVYIHDTIYITGEGIDGVDAMNAKIYTSQGQIVVEGADGNMVTLYDVTGRVLATKQDDYSPLRFDTPTSGTYMIKIGSYPARKVVVVR